MYFPYENMNTSRIMATNQWKQHGFWSLLQSSILVDFSCKNLWKNYGNSLIYGGYTPHEFPEGSRSLLKYFLNSRDPSHWFNFQELIDALNINTPHPAFGSVGALMSMWSTSGTISDLLMDDSFANRTINSGWLAEIALRFMIFSGCQCKARPWAPLQNPVNVI